MSYTPDFPYMLEVISGRAVSHLSIGDDWDALAISPESLPLTTPELTTPEVPAQIPDHNTFIPIDLEPLPPSIMNILDSQEMESADFEEAGPLPPPNMHSPDSQETEDANVQAIRARPPPDVHTPNSQGAGEAGIQTGEFLRLPSVQVPDSQETEDTDSQMAGSLPQPNQDYSNSQETEDVNFQAREHLLPSDVYTPDSQETESADFEAAGPLPSLDVHTSNSQQTYIYVTNAGSPSESPVDPQESETDDYAVMSLSTGSLGSQNMESDLDRPASQEAEPEPNNLVLSERLGSENPGYDPRAPATTRLMTRAVWPEKYPGIAFPDLPGKKLSFKKRAKLHTNEMLLKLLLWARKKKTNLVIGTNNISSSWRVLKLAEAIGPHIVMLRLMPKPMKVTMDDNKGLILFQEKLNEISKRHKFVVMSCKEVSWGRKESAYIVSGDSVERMGAQRASACALFEPKTEIESDGRPGFGFLVLTEKKELRGEYSETPDGQTRSQSSVVEIILKDDKPKKLPPKQKYRAVVWDDKGHSRHIDTDTPTSTSYPVHTPSIGNEDDEFDDSLIAFHMKVNCLSGDGKIGYTPTRAISSGADFFIVQEEIWNADDPVKMARKYQEEGWKAYLAKTKTKRKTKIKTQ